MERASHGNKSDRKRFSMDGNDIYASLSLKKLKEAEKRLKRRRRQDFSKANQRQGTEKLSLEFKKLLEKHSDEKRVAFLKRNFSEYFGRNFASQYKKQYGFAEEWQEAADRSQKGTHDDINNLSKLEILAIFVLMLAYIVSLWYSNINHFFSQDCLTTQYLTVYAIAILAFLADTALRALHHQPTFDLLHFFRTHYQSLCCAGYLTLKSTSVMAQSSHWWVLELVFSYFVCVRVNQLYEMVRFLKLRLYHTYQSRIMDLILTLLVILHIVAIILFSATKAGYQRTWLSQIKDDIQPLTEFTLYLYAFYFGTTTILTVGYGDIAAKNPLEVAVVILVEIIGILMFSYLINEIGYSISTLRKGRELIENDLSVLEKMRKHYRMKDDITNQARNSIINHKPDSNLLQPNNQKNLLMKFNQPLRNHIVTSNNLGVIKSSLFFLTKWSNTFQRSIANKLIHQLFPPNDLIYQPLGNERIYIFKSGRVNVYAQSNGHKKRCDNTLKVIDCKTKHQVADNCYGYTAVISKRPSRLYACSKDFTSSYFVDKETFMQVVNERSQDLELYHQILSKMDLEKFCEAYQVPLLRSSRHHYIPTVINVIKKYRKHTGVSLNSRTRSHQRTTDRHRRTGDFYKNDENLQKIIRQRLGTKQPEKLQASEEFSLTSNESSFVNFVIQSSDKEQVMGMFEAKKQFSNYFKNHNVEIVLRKIELKTLFLDRTAFSPDPIELENKEEDICEMLPHLRATVEKDSGIGNLHTEHHFK